MSAAPSVTTSFKQACPSPRGEARTATDRGKACRGESCRKLSVEEIRWSGWLERSHSQGQEGGSMRELRGQRPQFSLDGVLAGALGGSSWFLQQKKKLGLLLSRCNYFYLW